MGKRYIESAIVCQYLHTLFEMCFGWTQSQTNDAVVQTFMFGIKWHLQFEKAMVFEHCLHVLA